MKKDDIYRSQFRLPYSLYEKLKESAEANNRSVNAELVFNLERSLNLREQINGMYEEVSLENKELPSSEVWRLLSTYMSNTLKIMVETAESLEKEDNDS